MLTKSSDSGYYFTFSHLAQTLTKNSDVYYRLRWAAESLADLRLLNMWWVNFMNRNLDWVYQYHRASWFLIVSSWGFLIQKVHLHGCLHRWALAGSPGRMQLVYSIYCYCELTLCSCSFLLVHPEPLNSITPFTFVISVKASHFAYLNYQY